MTALARASGKYKRQTRPLVREGAPRKQERNCHTEINIWSWAPDGARYQDLLTDWLTVSRNVTLTLTLRYGNLGSKKFCSKWILWGHPHRRRDLYTSLWIVATQAFVEKEESQSLVIRWKNHVLHLMGQERNVDTRSILLAVLSHWRSLRLELQE
jgi:hypothetical protein